MAINYKKTLQVIGISLSVILLFYFSIPILFPFYISIILALMILPPVRFIEKNFRLPRGLAIFLILLFLLLGSLTVLSFGMIELVQFLQQFSTHLPEVFETVLNLFYHTILPWVEQLIGTFASLLSGTPEYSQNYLIEIVMDFAESLRDYSQSFLLNLIESIVQLITAFFQSSYLFILILLSTYFFAKDGPRWGAAILSKIPKPVRGFFIELRRQGFQVIKKYFFAQLLIVILSGMIIWVGLTILKVEHALAIALFSMLLDFIPMIGISVVFIPWILYTFITQSFSMTIGLSILLIFLIIFRNVIEPKLIGSSLGVHPLVLILLIFLFFRWFGVLGILLTPFVLIAVITIQQTGIAKEIQRYIMK